ALSPAMVRMAAQVADGLLLWTTPASYIADVVIPEATRAREHRGFSMEGCEVTPIVSSAYVTDPAAAIEGARTELHRYFGLPFYRTMFKAAGFGADLEPTTPPPPTSTSRSRPSPTTSSASFAFSGPRTPSLMASAAT